MEFFDVLDDKGQLTGELKNREEVHRLGLWHRTVHVWIVNGQRELLIQKRSAQMQFCPNLWDISSAGHIEAGHSSIDTAIKEVEEELGLKLSESDFKHIFTVVQQFEWNDGILKNNEYNDVYLVKKDLNVNELKFDPVEVAEVKLIGIEELENKIKNKDESFVNHDAEYEELFKYFKKTGSAGENC